MVPLICILVALSGLVVSAPVPEQKEQYYTTKYDHVDIEMILSNRRLIYYYTACMLNKGPCSPEGLEFKRLIPDAIQTNCKRCTEKQKVGTVRAIKGLMKEYPKVWDQLKAEWDPDDIYVEKFLATHGNFPNINMISNRFDADEPSEPTQTSVSNSTESSSNDSSTTPNASSKPSSTTPRQSSTTSSTTLGIYYPPSLDPGTIPIANTIGQGIKATVSLGNNIVRKVIKDIETIGNTVVLTGAKIAENIGNSVIQTRNRIATVLREATRPQRKV
uniref:Chemosensory protein n=1 Tax=Galeruca daurica TaxID=1651263 RepID=A0A1W6GWJ3_9CUCU|nr:chemosensory protein [Galeruca daurica]